MILPALMMYSYLQILWVRQHSDNAIPQHAYWMLPAYLCIHHLKHKRTDGKLIQILIITTPNQLRLAPHLGYRTWLTWGVRKRIWTGSTPIPPMWPSTYSITYTAVSEWSPVFPLNEMVSAGGSTQPQLRPFANTSMYRILLKPTMSCWQKMTQYWIKRTKKTSWKSQTRGSNGMAHNIQSPLLFGDGTGRPEPRCYTAGISLTKQDDGGQRILFRHGRYR